MDSEFVFLPSQVLILRCHQHADALTAASAVKQHKSVVVDTEQMDAAAAQRLLDFVAGAVDAIDGNAERLGENSFLFTPHQVQVIRMDSAVEVDRQ